MSKEIEIRGTPGLNLPMFSDAVQVSVTMKESADKKERSGYMRFTFLDTTRKQVLSEIVIDHMHARDFAKLITANVKALDQAIKKGKLPKKKAVKKTENKTKTKTISDSDRYIR